MELGDRGFRVLLTLLSWATLICPNVMAGINYDKLTDEQAIDILKQECGKYEVEPRETEIISASDVLYYYDAYGELEDAILLQKWDKSLPKSVHQGLVESGLDIYEGVNVHELDKEQCPMCDQDMWEFEINEGSFTSTYHVDEYGAVPKYSKLVSCIEGNIWNADEKEHHSSVMCASCNYTGYRQSDFYWSREPNFTVFYDETDEVSYFSVSDNMVRWDFESHISNEVADLWKLPGEHRGLPQAVAKNEINGWLDEYHYMRITFDNVVDSLERNGYKVNQRRLKRVYDDVTEHWTSAAYVQDKSNDDRPKLDFTYVIDEYTKTHPCLYVSRANESQLFNKIIQELKSKASSRVIVPER